MKRLFVSAVAAGVLLAVAVLSQFSRSDPRTPAPDLQARVAEKNPWTHLRLNNDRDEFRFALVSDRTGGARPGVFERAVEQLNLLQPEFVVSVGDLIEGGSEDLEKVNREWQEFDGFVSRLQMPFFYVPGNHDISNPLMDRRWREKFGRSYYHFLYRNVLFLLLNTENPPGNKSGKLSQEQVAYARQVLKENRTARWTIVVLHRPVWTSPDLATTGWLEVEQALAGRPYTVFAGHNHKYQRFLRNGQRYYILGTTGGASNLRGLPLGEFDHLVWVTMKKEGPLLTNLMVEGIFPEDIKTGPELRPASKISK